MKLIKKFFYSTICVFGLVFNSYADLEGASNFSKEFSEEIFNIVKQEKNVSQIREELILYVKENIDITWTSRFVLGKHWKTTTPVEKAQFTNLFEEYLILNYAPKFEGYNGENYSIIDTKMLAPKKYVTKLILTLSDKTEILVEIYILEKNNTFKAVDIAGEGVSFAATQRAEFNSLITANGFPKFLDMLEDKIANLKTPQTTENASK